MNGEDWIALSSDGIPLFRIKYNGNYIVNDSKLLSDEYLGKIAHVQDELLIVREYVGLYEHASQMKVSDVFEY